MVSGAETFIWLSIAFIPFFIFIAIFLIVQGEKYHKNQLRIFNDQLNAKKRILKELEEAT